MTCTGGRGGRDLIPVSGLRNRNVKFDASLVQRYIGYPIAAGKRPHRKGPNFVVELPAAVLRIQACGDQELSRRYGID
jgi:hypothetical protein